MEAKEKFDKINNIYSNEIRKAKKLYYDAQFETFSNDMKKTWSFINTVIKKQRAKNDVSKLGLLLTQLLKSKEQKMMFLKFFIMNIKLTILFLKLQKDLMISLLMLAQGLHHQFQIQLIHLRAT